MNNFYRDKFYLIMIFTVMLMGCANQQPPQGGPVDLTTPVIVSTYPENNRLNFKDNKIRLEFDRYVEERSLEESIFISPYVGTLDFDWNGTEVEITFSEKLRPNTTYVINIGTDVKDIYRGLTHMAKAYTLAFSTGSEIDKGGIDGFVYPWNKGQDVSGVMIFAYHLDNINPDTLNPSTAEPDFITQTGKKGDFSLYRIPFGKYRIFAIRDEYRNLVYDREIDEYGVPSGIISISASDTLASGIVMQLAKEDTSGPRIIKAYSVDINHVVTEYSESIIQSSINPGSFMITDTTARKNLDVIAVYSNPNIQKSYTLVTQNQDSAETYSVLVEGITDSSGNKINPLANSVLFQGLSRKITTKIRLNNCSIKDSVTKIDLRPILTLAFSDALAKTVPLDFINILDNAKKIVPVERLRLNDALISIKPEGDLNYKSWYTLRAELRKVRDWRDSTSRDSTKEWRFETLDIEDMSNIDGNVIDLNTVDTTGDLYVKATQIGKKSTEYLVRADDVTGKFLFQIVPEGQYVFQAFRDRNRNGMYDAGKPFPFVYSERISRLSDTLKVRARWPLEGVRIELK